LSGLPFRFSLRSGTQGQAFSGKVQHASKIDTTMVSREGTSLFIQPSGLRPDCRLLFPFIFGDDAPNVDTDGDSHNPASQEWTEFYCQNREKQEEIFDIAPVLDNPLVLKIFSEIQELAARVAYFFGDLNKITRRIECPGAVA